MVPAVAGGMAQASMFAFITGSPFIFMGRFGFTEQQYSFVFGATAFGLMAGAQVNRMALRKVGVPTMLSVALGVNLVAVIALNLMAATDQPFLLMLPLWFVIASLGMIGGNAAAIAMNASGQHPGTASALVGILQFAFAFTVSSLVAASQNGTAYPMTVAMLTVAVLGSSLWFIATRGGTQQQG
jgi:DHA1 family bicyclomycin/chloramphenicol resistance-like MFS transporter